MVAEHACRMGTNKISSIEPYHKIPITSCCPTKSHGTDDADSSIIVGTSQLPKQGSCPQGDDNQAVVQSIFGERKMDECAQILLCSFGIMAIQQSNQSADTAIEIITHSSSVANSDPAGVVSEFGFGHERPEADGTNRYAAVKVGGTAKYETCRLSCTTDLDGSEWVGIVGLGTLMSEASARRTAPSSRGFTPCTVPGFIRAFQHVSHHMLRRGPPFALYETREFAGLSCEPKEGASFTGCYFEVPLCEYPAIVDREDMYELVPVRVECQDGVPRLGMICARTTDEQVRANMGDQVFERKYGRFFNGHPIHGPTVIWGDISVLPSRVYLRHCILTLRSQAGEEAAEAFQLSTFLADHCTTVFEYLKNHPTIMETAPPADHPDASAFNGV
eukprot:gene7161-2675_t